MSWWIALLGVAVGGIVFMWAFGRRLEVLSGPWIAKESVGND